MTMTEPVFFDGWASIVRIGISVPIMYFAIILFIRLAGKRSTSQMNNFDWVVTVAMGTLAASCMIQASVTILDSLLAIGGLLVLQWIVTKLIYHFPWVSHVVKAEPALLVSDGELLHGTLCRERVNQDEVLAAVRENGLSSLDEVRWVILETDATISVIARSEDNRSLSAMKGVGGFVFPHDQK
jgi:uncharacterized membrane protein YcaP (DUF421 family)